VIAVGACSCHGKHPHYSGWGDALWSYDERGHGPFYGFGCLDPIRAIAIADRKHAASSV
jgi:hypothetical protein